MKEFIPHIIKTLNAQKINYNILVVEQEAGKPFNRGKLLNAGFDYTRGTFDYYCFHDIDMLPVEADYSFCSCPTHLATRVEQFNWKLPGDNYFGGVVLFDKKSFKKIDGYSNEYWGWGVEDDDVYARCVCLGIPTSRKNCSFKSLPHERKIIKEEYERNLDTLKSFHNAFGEGIKEGLDTLEYTVLETKKYDTYTKILVSI